MKKFALLGLTLLIVLSFALTSCAPAQEATPAVVEEVTAEEVVEEEVMEEVVLEPIRVGLYAPLTGPIAFLGEGFDLGITLAIEELGGEIDGYPIEYFTADNKCNPTDAVNAVNKLIYVDEVDVIIGGGCSSATLGALPIILEGETPSISATSTNPSIYNEIGAGGNKWAFRINPDDLIMALGYAEYIQENGANSISLVAENTDFGRGAIGAYLPIFEGLGVEISSEDYFDLGTADFRSALTSMKSVESDAVLIVMTENDCANFMRQYREVGVDADVYSRGACTSPLFLELTQDDLAISEGIVEFAFFTSNQDPELAERFSARFDTPLTGHRMGGYYAMYYTVANAVRSVIGKGQEINRANIQVALEGLSVDTPAGLIEFDDHNQAYTDGVLSVNQDGEAIMLTIVELGPADHSIIK